MSSAPKRCVEPGCDRWALAATSRCRPHQRARWAVYNDPAYRAFTRASHCEECGAGTDLTRDHIVAVSRGGGNDPGNLRTLCRPCNARKGRTDDVR